ncbi:apolipoprotein N-acyltransferase [Ehrlichia muris]|uniref:Apolipoprotein N-acyltransferase n=1 Tax=Ehrlichia muris AS145 TaxID=1423892 RepID=V9R802_9RICK|nr:apolipoprotein N-acyltransferase [Ehrlichia muris]AHC38956.1 apolipoprotein N-acyltransferase [Ehrlichia muris AS145]
MIEGNVYKKYNYTLAMMLGVMGAISMAPFHMFIALLIAFSGFYVVLSQTQSTKQAFFCGWWFGFGYFTASSYWVNVPLIIQSKIFWPLIPFTLVLSASLSLLFATAAAISYTVNYKKLLGLITFSLSFTIAGMLLGYIAPWNLFAYSWSFSTEMLQTASLFGTYGMEFLAIFCSTAAGVCIRDKSISSCIIALLTLVSMFIYGSNRLLNNQEQKYNHDVAIRIVQGNTESHWNGNEELEYDIFQTYLRLTSKYGLNSRTHVVWGENSFPFLNGTNNSSIQNYLKFTIPKFLIAGGTRFENNKFYNTLFVINDNGQIIDYYDKLHLVPFGEFIPSILKNLIPQDIADKLNYTPGINKEKSISLNNQSPFIPLICYESIFSNEVVSRCRKGQWIINITNDGWFGISSQPYQHLEINRVRSIENGLPTIRAANSGISAVIDSYGRIIDSLPIMTEGIIDSYLPYHISEGTIYSRYLNKFITIQFATLIMLILVLSRFILSKLKTHRS